MRDHREQCRMQFIICFALVGSCQGQKLSCRALVMLGINRTMDLKDYSHKLKLRNGQVNRQKPIDRWIKVCKVQWNDHMTDLLGTWHYMCIQDEWDGYQLKGNSGKFQVNSPQNTLSDKLLSNGDGNYCNSFHEPSGT